MAETVQINLRVEAELAQELEKIATEESLRRSELARKYLIEGVKGWKLARAMERYQLGQISLERAATEANLSIYEMMERLRARGILLDQTTPAQAREEFQSLLRDLRQTGS